MVEKILIVVGHSDDQIIGVGGSASKYAKEGHEVYTVIFSQGEASHIYYQENIISKTREKETLNADKIIGGKKVFFLRVSEKNIGSQKEIDKAYKKLNTIINRIEPSKIFTHSKEDPHPVHKKTLSTLLKVLDSKKSFKKIDVYAFDVWNPFKFKKNKHPLLVIDISDYFNKKVKALRCFKSQFRVDFIPNYSNLFNVYTLSNMFIKNFFNGIKHGSKYAEVFHKLR